MKKAIWYLIVFAIIQMFSGVIISLFKFDNGEGNPASPEMMNMLLASVIAAVITLAIFLWRKWCPVSLNYIKTNPMRVLLLVVVITLASLVPSLWLEEFIPEEFMQNTLASLFEMILRSPLGYIIVAIIAPAIEEVVFRGAILRELLVWAGRKGTLSKSGVWTAIAISALFFSLIHGNPAQMPHAFLMGLLLGWLYYRTGSIIPGVLFHWANNTAAMLLANAFPEIPIDSHLDAYFGGSQLAVIVTAIISLMVFIPALWRFNKLTEKAPNATETSEYQDVLQ